MRVVRCINGKIACAPFDRTSVEMKERAGLVTIKQKGELASTEVVFGGHFGSGTYLDAGDTVYLRGEDRLSSWAKDVFEVQGKKFILVPEDRVLLTERGDPLANLLAEECALEPLGEPCVPST